MRTLLLFVALTATSQAQTAFVDQSHNIKINSDLSSLQYNATRTIYFDNHGPMVEANLPPDTGFIYIYNSDTHRGAIEFSRTPWYYYPLTIWPAYCPFVW
ncbi:MAG TPA: hypothetical protein VFW73_06250 [Lacipirellulaceae bacterium]|nr:hypothetical protein [Lacipirellulaceae bacterium]